MISVVMPVYNEEKNILKALKAKKTTYTDIKTEITKELNNFIKEETGRKPIVLPIILNIKHIKIEKYNERICL